MVRIKGCKVVNWIALGYSLSLFILFYVFASITYNDINITMKSSWWAPAILLFIMLVHAILIYFTTSKVAVVLTLATLLPQFQMAPNRLMVIAIVIIYGVAIYLSKDIFIKIAISVIYGTVFIFGFILLGLLFNGSLLNSEVTEKIAFFESPSREYVVEINKSVLGEVKPKYEAVIRKNQNWDLWLYIATPKGTVQNLLAEPKITEIHWENNKSIVIMDQNYYINKDDEVIKE